MREEDEDDGNLAEVDENLAEVLAEHEVRVALSPRLFDREALGFPLVSGSQIFALLISGQAEIAAERLRVVVEASLRWIRLDRSEVRRLLCALDEKVLLVAFSSGLPLEACNSSESESDKSQFDLYCCACLRCFGDDGMFPRILKGIAREWLLLVAVVAVAVVAVVVLLLLCKLHDMTSEDTVVIFTWCVWQNHSCDCGVLYKREEDTPPRICKWCFAFSCRTCWLQCGSVVVW